MAKNDMYVVMYRIIAYLYDCMKRGVEPEDAMWSSHAMGIPESYWTSIVEQLVSHGYITCVGIEEYFGGERMVSIFRPEVTMEGLAFAEENSMMGKARKFLQDAKAAIPFI